jgi:hypothetical protein
MINLDEETKEETLGQRGPNFMNTATGNLRS